MTHYSNLVFPALLIVLLIVALVVTVLLGERSVRDIRLRRTDIPRFSVNASWDPAPEPLVINNRYDCNARSLRICDLNDSTTLFGCRELAVSCHHFDRDIEYRTEGESITIPRNKSPNEGYALAINKLVDACNTNHGDFTLVSLTAESTDYLMICQCKNPGYIGNETLLGPCETPFICGGKIDRIDAPLNEINCICERGQRNVRYDDGLPVCKSLLVKEANELYDDWSDLVPWVSQHVIEREIFNPTVRDNLKTRVLLDPCKNSLHNTSIEIPNAHYSYRLKSCTFSDFGLPLRLGLFAGTATSDGDAGGGGDKSDKKEGSKGKTAESKIVPLDGGIITGKYRYIRLSDNIGGKRKLVSLWTTLPFVKQFAETEAIVRAPENVGVSRDSQLYITMDDVFYAGYCEGSWPYYNCYVRDHYKTRVHGVPIAGNRPCPPSFFWSREYWEIVESLAEKSISVEREGTYIKQDELAKVPEGRFYGVIFAAKGEKNLKSGLLSFRDSRDYALHRNSVT